MILVSIEARCEVNNEDVAGAAPTGDAPTTSEWSTILLPKVCLTLEAWRYITQKIKVGGIILSLSMSIYIYIFFWVMGIIWPILKYVYETLHIQFKNNTKQIFNNLVNTWKIKYKDDWKLENHNTKQAFKQKAYLKYIQENLYILLLWCQFCRNFFNNSCQPANQTEEHTTYITYWTRLLLLLFLRNLDLQRSNCFFITIARRLRLFNDDGRLFSPLFRCPLFLPLFLRGSDAFFAYETGVKLLGCEQQKYIVITGIIMGMGSANVRRRYNVTSFLSGWTHTQNDSWKVPWSLFFTLMSWGSWRPFSPAIRLFVQQHVQANKKDIKALHYYTIFLWTTSPTNHANGQTLSIYSMQIYFFYISWNVFSWSHVICVEVN